MIELTLPTMTCGHCVKTVTQTVQRLDAQAKVEIELEKHQCAHRVASGCSRAEEGARRGRLSRAMS